MSATEHIPAIAVQQLSTFIPLAVLQEGYALAQSHLVQAARVSLELGGVWSIQSKVLAWLDESSAEPIVESSLAPERSKTASAEQPSYWQIIELRFSSVRPGELISLEGTCACAAGKNCAHIAAAIFSVTSVTDFVPMGVDDAAAAAGLGDAADLGLESAQMLQQRTVAEQWLQQTLSKQASSPATQQTAQAAALSRTGADDSRPERLVYVLQAQARPLQARLLERLQFVPMMSRPKVHGKGWTKPRGLGYEVEYHIRGMEQASLHLDIYRLFQSLSDRQALSLSFALVRGYAGQTLLHLAAQSGYLFWQEADGPNMDQAWHLGAARSLAWTWHAVQAQGAADLGSGAALATDALWQLDWNFAGETDEASASIQVLVGSPCLYFDRARQSFGLLELGDMTPERFESLCSIPPMPQSVLVQQTDNLLRLLDGLPVPEVLADIPTLSSVPPQGFAHLSLWPAHERSYRGLARLRLWWDYAGFRFTADASTEKLHTVLATKATATNATGQTTERAYVQRAVEQEAALQKVLRQLGLRPLFQNVWGLDLQLDEAGIHKWLDWIAQDFAILREAGFVLQIDPDLAQFVEKAGTVAVTVQAESGSAGAAEPGTGSGQTIAQQWFTMSLGVEINGQRRNVLPWLSVILQQCRLTDTGAQLPDAVFIRHPDKPDGYIHLDVCALHPWMQALLELTAERGKEMSSKDQVRLSGLDALRLGSLLHEQKQLGGWSGLESLHALYNTLRGQTRLPQCALPSGLQAQLRPYQQQGLDWLQFLRTWGLGGVLADDMGLGKTLQTLVHILVEKAQGRLQHPALVVAPVSLMGNWASEVARFTPELSLLTYHGSERHHLAQQWSNHDIVLTSYSLLHRERARWLAQPWHMVILDEAQNIKNANTHAAQVVGDLDAGQRICLSGTPMENHLGELWSLFHFLMPGFLGTQSRFVRQFRTPIEKNGDAQRMTQLRARVAPFMLRRTKAAVASELPPKIETISHVQLEGEQADLYETIRLATEKEVRHALALHGLAKSQITLLDALLKLRQVCCDPRLVSLPRAQSITQSAKLQWLCETLPDMLAEGRRILLFSQFTSMLELIERALQPLGLQWAKLTGSSTKRDEIIARFTSGEVPLFLISLKAGGVGLNLAQADTVIHYDPWWNPAVEEQATDRAHRIGQTQTVLVYKLVAANTIEERILALQQRKAELAESVYSGVVARKEPMFTESDVLELLRPLGP